MKVGKNVFRVGVSVYHNVLLFFFFLQETNINFTPRYLSKTRAYKARDLTGKGHLSGSLCSLIVQIDPSATLNAGSRQYSTWLQTCQLCHFSAAKKAMLHLAVALTTLYSSFSWRSIGISFN